MSGAAPPPDVLYGNDVGLSCGPNGELRSEEMHGLFAGDTRILSTYRLTIAGHEWRPLARSRLGPSSAQWDMQNVAIRTPSGDLDEGKVHCRLRRHVFGALHDCLVVTSFSEQSVPVRFSLQFDADFMDVFEVKDGTLPPRLTVRRVPGPRSMSLIYERRDFRRALHVTFTCTSTPTFVGSQAVFDLMLERNRPWRLCVEGIPELDGRRLKLRGDPHAAAPTAEASLPANADAPTIATEPILAAPFEQGRIDIQRLAMRYESGADFIAAGAPWFLALFGRDTLVTSLMASLLGSWHADGALAALAATRSQTYDDFRDAQPGKLAHELRRGELAHFRAIPHTPYYGTHDAPALYVLALWNAFRWTGDRELLTRHLPVAESALRWCEELGDADGDGLLEYRTRSRRGYRNQGWKDSGDAIPHEDGTLADLPIATVELQGYWYAAQCAMAELLDATGEGARARELRERARTLRALVEDRFWMEDLDCYALALDGKKRVVRSIASNPGHLLWCGLPSPERAGRVARRLMADDMFSGYGLRTLSAAHRRYNPLSYQLGSVWPHDSALFAAGLMRYGLRDSAAAVYEGAFEAARAFDYCLPELFCGFAREEGQPVPYPSANMPQAWAAAAPILAVQTLLGLVPDAANGRCYLSPWLPQWISELTVRGIEIGGGRLDVKIVRQGTEAHLEYAHHPTIEIVRETPPAPLWGAPL